MQTKKKKTVTSPDRSTCEILNAGATTIEDMLIYPPFLWAVPKKIPPQVSDLARLKTAYFWGLKNTTAIYTGSIHPKPLEGPIADPKGTQQIIHAAYILGWIQRAKTWPYHRNPRVFVACEPMKAPDAGGWIFMERKSTRNCHLFQTKIYTYAALPITHYVHFKELFSWSQDPTSSIWDFGSSLYLLSSVFFFKRFSHIKCASHTVDGRNPIPNHLGCIKPRNYWEQTLPTSTGEFTTFLLSTDPCMVYLPTWKPSKID